MYILYVYIRGGANIDTSIAISKYTSIQYVQDADGGTYLLLKTGDRVERVAVLCKMLLSLIHIFIL